MIRIYHIPLHDIISLSNFFSTYCVYFNRYPIDHIDECDGSKYFLQLNIYRYILHKYYDMSVSYMAVASFHPNTGDSYFMVEVPVWEREVESVFEEMASGRTNSDEILEMSPPRTRPQAQQVVKQKAPVSPVDEQYDIPF